MANEACPNGANTHKACLAAKWLKGFFCVEGRAAGGVAESAAVGALSIYTVTAREAHLCGERGSPAAGKGIVCLQAGYAPPSGGKCLVAFGG